MYPDSQVEESLQTLDTITGSMHGRVVLFNDEHHTFEEVIVQILRAVHCSMDRAEQLTWEVHNTGKATVYEGPLSECLHVSAVLEEIALKTEVQC
ncbi:MAG: ATP-dependent Clp protease adaptor ClpS [Bacteroidota bacterium]|nr:ATP-dependent Clp protease adaptor ClpS [bacterium]NBP63396.1 ATP-dependent Clp protease adaptor ClpS [Bacteroidota bacterium]